MNKLMARIVAVVMAIAMLGTVSFAASIDAEKNTISADNTADLTVETVLAFATNTVEAKTPGENDTIIAIDQAADVPSSFEIETSKIAGYDYIAIVFSGAGADEPEYAYITIPDDETKLTAVDVVRSFKAEDGTVYENIVKATFTETPESGKTLKEYGIEFVQTGLGTEQTGVTLTGKANRIPQPVTSAVSGAITFTAAIVGAPAGATFTATPYFIYEN